MRFGFSEMATTSLLISGMTHYRTAARLLAIKVDRAKLAKQGLRFVWASGRIRAGTFEMSLTLELGPYQILVDVPWDGETPEEMATQCAALLEKSPSKWNDVQWIPQQAEIGPPSIAGPMWRRFRT